MILLSPSLSLLFMISKQILSVGTNWKGVGDCFSFGLILSTYFFGTSTNDCQLNAIQHAPLPVSFWRKCEQISLWNLLVSLSFSLQTNKQTAAPNWLVEWFSSLYNSHLVRAVLLALGPTCSNLSKPRVDCGWLWASYMKPTKLLTKDKNMK